MTLQSIDLLREDPGQRSKEVGQDLETEDRGGGNGESAPRPPDERGAVIIVQTNKVTSLCQCLVCTYDVGARDDVVGDQLAEVPPAVGTVAALAPRRTCDSIARQRKVVCS